MTSQFIHLHTHSHYSLLDAMTKIKDLVARAKELEMPALAVTDHGNMYAGIEFYKACVAAGIKPIMGFEAYVTPGSLHDKQPGVDTTRYHLTLLAKNQVGYKNIIKLVTIAQTEGFFIRPRLDKKALRENTEGVICLSGTFDGELSKMLRANEIEKARDVIREHIDIFGKENYFIELTHRPNTEGFMEVRKQLIKLAKEFDLDVVATADSHYLYPDDARAHDTLLAIQNNSETAQETRFVMSEDDYSFIDEKEAFKRFKDIPEAVTNTKKVSDMCNVEIELGKWTFPDYKIPEGTTYDSELRRLAYEGIEKHGLQRTPELLKRLDYELKVIKDKGYPSYFLIVSDLLRHAKKHHIYTTIRGSVAGSLATYLIDITKVNPLEYKLPFERFLNPERPSAPDIDMDFADNRRDEVLDYAREKYGIEKVAQIGTFGTMMAKGAIRDVARAMGFPYAVGDKISNMIPMGSQGFPMTIDHAIEIEPDLAKLYKEDPDTKEIIDMAKRLEGCARHISVHAAGVVISPTLLTDFVPTQLDPKGGKLITQYDGHVIEEAGLIKFDFLGIRNLAILGDAVRLVKKFQGIEIDIEKVPVDDQKTFKMLARGETMGVFQLSGGGMTRYLKELRPTVIHDINAMVALYRPGPMEMIPEYIKRKYNPHLIQYLDPRLKDILDQSYGVITYQDDVMMISIKLAGYSWLEADKLRKAMGKKIPELMDEQKKKLFKGFLEHGLSKEKIKKLWELIEPFAAYGFNKAHAASYGRLAYQTAYMKANYPAEYMTAVMTAESGDAEKISEIITECKRLKIPVLPPDVNESKGNFTVIKAGQNNNNPKDKIRFGLHTIKNLGSDISDAIREERKNNGKYTSYSTFLERVQHKNMSKRSLEALIKAGALDELGNRSAMLGNLEESLAYNRHIHSMQVSAQDSLFGGMDDSALPQFKLHEAPEISKDQLLKWEKELLGLYVSGHPLDKFKEKFAKRTTDIHKTKTQARDKMQVVVAGIIEEMKEIFTKKGDKMAFVRIADFSGTIEVVVFPKTLVKFKELIELDRLVVIKGKVSKRNGETGVLAEVIKELI